MNKEDKPVGRPEKYNEKTKVIAFRLPLSSIDLIKEVVNGLLVKLEK